MAIVLDWTPVVGADSYIVYRDTAPFDENSLPASLGSVSGTVSRFEDNTIVAGTSYYYRIGAKMSASSKIALSDMVMIVPGTSGGPAPDTTALLRLTFENGTNGNADATDEALTPNTLTWNGAAACDATSPIAGSLDLALNIGGGSSDTITFPNFDITGDFTMEVLYNLDQFAGIYYIDLLSNYNAGTAGSWSFWIDSASGSPPIPYCLDFFIDPGTVRLRGSTAVYLGETGHAAVTRSGNVWSLYVNGVLEKQVTASVSGLIGANANTTIGNLLVGHMDNIRIGSNVRYTSNFEVPTDLDAPIVSLKPIFLSCDGTDGSTAIGDDNHPSETYTVTGDVALTSATAPAGNATSLTRPTSGRVEFGCPRHRFTFGDMDFTIEADIYIASGSAEQTICSMWSNDTDRCWLFGINGSNQLIFYFNSSGSSTKYLAKGSAIPTATWTHAAIVRYGDTLRFYVGGSLVGTDTILGHVKQSTTSPVWALSIENTGSTDGATWQGNIANLKITKGVALYTT